MTVNDPNQTGAGHDEMDDDDGDGDVEAGHCLPRTHTHKTCKGVSVSRPISVKKGNPVVIR